MVPLLTSKRLNLEKLSTRFCSQEYVNWLNDPRVFRYLESGGDYTLEKLRSYLEKVEANPDMLFWAILLKESGKHIGNIKIDPVEWKHGRAHYGILVGDATEWNKGYAREASETVLSYCFRELHLRKITLGVVSKHMSAVKLYQSLGFRIEGVLKSHNMYEQEYCDVDVMALFNPEFTS